MSDLNQVFVGLGSNIKPEHHLHQAIDSLRKHYDALELSPIYRSAAVGFKGPKFLNLVVSFFTSESHLEVHRFLRSLEQEIGRQRSFGDKLSSRPIDLDLLLYGDVVINEETFKVPHNDITKYSFVLRPLAELAGEVVHPLHGCRLDVLAEDLDLEPEILERVELAQG